MAKARKVTSRTRSSTLSSHLSAAASAAREILIMQIETAAKVYHELAGSQNLRKLWTSHAFNLDADCGLHEKHESM